MGGRGLTHFDTRVSSLRFAPFINAHSLRFRSPLRSALSAFGSFVAPLPPPVQLAPLRSVALLSGCFRCVVGLNSAQGQGSALALLLRFYAFVLQTSLLKTF